MINRASIEKIHAYTEIGKDEGATLLTGGEVATGNGLDKGFYYRPTSQFEGGVGCTMVQVVVDLAEEHRREIDRDVHVVFGGERGHRVVVANRVEPDPGVSIAS